MDLTKEHPRSPYDEMAGIVSLPRMVDKTRADAEGTLGEYDVDCPHDRPVLEFLGIDFATFAAKIKELDYKDAAIESWAQGLVRKHSPEEIAAFNDSRRNWGPDDHSQPYFDQLREAVAPTRHDVKTWFELLDMDEGRIAA
ncbi:MAG: DUF5069 domain-containing protein [Candidatus Eremiobacteraeota bacterium]|nr:DUF5069 domain-containing protein [Candidatus Eremiobacteraeota bacterium]